MGPYCRLVVFIVIIGTVNTINEKEYTLDDECGQHSTNLELAQVRSAQEPADYVTLDHRLIGGSETRPHAWPWTVQLLSRLGQHRCGGSLIDPNFVLTAAHCFAKDRRPTSYSVRVGGHRSGSGSPHRVTAVSIHPWYNIGFPSSYDFAIMRYEGLQGFSEGIFCFQNPSTRQHIYHSKTNMFTTSTRHRKSSVHSHWLGIYT
ncbi:hypothetical protein B9Z55_006473 [Caenorhabditis nigoni]|uniref:Peptidase S1 domain-containing protein n=1 Tax=Caenorhabditis nigoni TaxID=1611254 RepID=A0A2G5V5Q7_9PELO|nr:hypothetical protein B9Z55_006473 [Caenorhabditis nigoni]